MIRKPRSIARPFLLFALAVCVGCTNEGSSSTATLPRGVVVLAAEGRTVRVDVEVVRRPTDRARGLMDRKELAPYAGMLFIFEQEKRQSFWMKNTYLTLDMIFINDAREVVGIIEEAAPLTTRPRQVPAPSRYVLEVNGGFARQHGIRKGTRVQLEMGTRSSL